MTFNCIVYAEFDNVLEIDSSWQVIVDFSDRFLYQNYIIFCFNVRKLFSLPAIMYDLNDIFLNIL